MDPRLRQRSCCGRGCAVSGPPVGPRMLHPRMGELDRARASPGAATIYAQDMRAMVLEAPGTPLREAQLPDPEPAAGQVLLEVHACGVCRTDLHIVDGELTEPKLP